MNHVGFVAGLASGLWAGYFMTFWKSAFGEFWGWRILILLQLIPAFIFAVGLPYLPERLVLRSIVPTTHLQYVQPPLARRKGSHR